MQKNIDLHFLKELFGLQRNIDFHIFSKNHSNGKDKWISTFSKRIILIAKKHFDWEETFWLQRGHSVIDINFQVFSKMVKQRHFFLLRCDYTMLQKLYCSKIFILHFLAQKYICSKSVPGYPDFASLLQSKIACFITRCANLKMLLVGSSGVQLGLAGFSFNALIAFSLKLWPTHPQSNQIKFI